MKLTHHQYYLLADAGCETSTVVFGGLVATIVFSKEPTHVSSFIWGLIALWDWWQNRTYDDTTTKV